MASPAVDVHRLTRAEYERMAAAGFFHPDERVELIDGIIYAMTPQSSAHATGVQLVEGALRSVAPPGSSLRIQMPLALGDDSEPEPDVAVVPGSPRDHRDAHPATALLVVEVADSSLLHDRRRKLPVYARAGVPETWILNLPRRVLEVYRDPAGESYRHRQVLQATEHVSPLVQPDAALAVADLLP